MKLSIVRYPLLLTAFFAVAVPGIAGGQEFSETDQQAARALIEEATKLNGYTPIPLGFYEGQITAAVAWNKNLTWVVRFEGGQFDSAEAEDAFVNRICVDEQYLEHFSAWGTTLTVRIRDRNGEEVHAFYIDRSVCGQEVVATTSGSNSTSSGGGSAVGYGTGTSAQEDVTYTSSGTGSTAGTGSTTYDQIVYSTEYFDGVQYQVGTSKDYTVYMAAFTASGGGRKTVLRVIAVNHGRSNVNFIPSTTEVLHETTKGLVNGEVFSAIEWEKKQRRKATVAAILAGVAAGLSNSRPAYGSGTYTNSYGGTGTFTYSYYDSAAAASRAMHDAALWGGMIERNYQNLVSGLAVAETLSPGEATGGEIHVAKDPRGTLRSQYSVRLGSDVFRFVYRSN